MNYTDLLGKKWEEMHCGEVVVEGLRRFGMEEAALHVPADQEGAAAMVRSLEGEENTGAWVMIARPDMKHRAREMDVVVADGPSKDGDEYHVSLVLTGGWTLTSSKSHGVHCVELRNLRGVRGVYRWLPGHGDILNRLIP